MTFEEVQETINGMKVNPKVLYRARRYFRCKWCTWYEACPVVQTTLKFFVVLSGNFPNTPLYLGGKFRVNKLEIESNGKVYHSRYGEEFYLKPPNLGDLFPSEDLMKTPDAITLEANQVGWDTTLPMSDWHDWQKNCYLYASFTGSTLRYAVDLWKSGKLEEAWINWKKAN